MDATSDRVYLKDVLGQMALEELTHARILLVDDDEDNLALLDSALKRAGARHTASVSDPFAAAAVYREFRPDVVLLDYAMPNMNGLEAARLISASMPQCGLILFTMFASHELSTLAQAAGVHTVVSKEIGGVHALVEAIEKITSEAA